MNKSFKLEIQLKEPKIEAPPAAVQLRLVAANSPLTMEKLTLKLERAEAKRLENLQLRSTAENRMSRQEKSR